MEKEYKERARIACILSINAGFMDGFSFYHYNGRFIGTQSGNIIQSGINFACGNWGRFYDFIIPMIFFSLGVITRGLYSYYLKKENKSEALHLLRLQWSGVTIFSVIYGIGIPLSVSVYVGILSYFMAIQYDFFTKVHGLPYGSIFMTGNVRLLAANMTQFFITKDKKYIHSINIYLLLIVLFVVGGILSVMLGELMEHWTMIVSSLLLGSVCMMVKIYE